MRLIQDDALAVATIKGEAEGEPYAAKLGVAHAIRNRMAKRLASDGTVSGTVLLALQFSCWNTHDPGRIRMARVDPSLYDYDADCVRAWSESADPSTDPTGGATDYFSPSTHSAANGSSFGYPGWSAAYTKTCEIGRIWFYVRTPPTVTT